MFDPCPLDALDLVPELVALDARAYVMRDPDLLPAGSTAVLFRFATEGMHPLALAAPAADLRRLLAAIERALADAVESANTPKAVAHENKWGTTEYRPDRPSWITAGLVERFGAELGSPEGVLDGIDAAMNPQTGAWTITLRGATGLAFAYRARLGLVEELWDLLYERWQDLDPTASLWI